MYKNFTNKKDLAWLKYYNILKSIFEKEGHCHISKTKHNTSLYNWICRQRMQKKDGTLKLEREILLININFRFNESWEDMFQIFLEYYNKYKNFYIDKDNEFYPLIGRWLEKQIKLFQKSQLPNDKILKYKKLGISINTSKTLDDLWMESYNELKNLFIENGHCTVPNTKDFKSLYRFTQTQRYNFRNKKLNSFKIQLLKDINFCFDVNLAQWLTVYQKASNYYALNNNLNVSFIDSKNRDLYNWISSNRQKFKNGKLTLFQIKKLEEIGFIFKIEPLEKKWLNKFYKAEKFYYTHGHCLINSVDCSKELYLWALEQCDEFKNKTISKKKLDYLNSIEFDFSLGSISTKKWFEKYSIAKEFYKLNGHCLISRLDCNESMYKWVKQQRFNKAHGLLNDIFEKYLNDIEFKFDESWDNMFRRFNYYYELHKSLNISNSYHIQYNAVNKWLNEQAKLFNNNKLPANIVHSFYEIGVDLGQIKIS